MGWLNTVNYWGGVSEKDRGEKITRTTQSAGSLQVVKCHYLRMFNARSAVCDKPGFLGLHVFENIQNNVVCPVSDRVHVLIKEFL